MGFGWGLPDTPQNQKTKKTKNQKTNLLELSRLRNWFCLRLSRHATKPIKPKKQKNKKTIFCNLVGLGIGLGKGLPDTAQNQKNKKTKKQFFGT